MLQDFIFKNEWTVSCCRIITKYPTSKLIRTPQVAFSDVDDNNDDKSMKKNSHVNNVDYKYKYKYKYTLDILYYFIKNFNNNDKNGIIILS